MAVAGIPGYELEARIAAGRHGEVWRARTADGEVRALKLVPAARVADAARFAREAAALIALSHRHVIRCHDSGRSGDQLWLAMDLAAGDLAGLIRSGPVDPGVALAVGRDIADGLAELARRGLVHRDVTPANVLRLADGRWVLGDFGLVAADAERLTATGEVIGTPAFLAPEQARGERAGPAADIHALGATLYAAATGAPPFAGGTWAVLQQVASGAFPDPRDAAPAVLPGLRAIIRAATGGRAEDRYPDARQVVEDCAAVIAGGVPRHAGTVNMRRRDAAAPAPAAPAPRARLAPVLAAAAGAAALAAVAGWLAARRDPGERTAFADAAAAGTVAAWQAYRDAHPGAPGAATADAAITLLSAPATGDTAARDRLRAERDALVAELARLHTEAR